MIRETNNMTFTKRLNYSVSEVSVEEFMSVLNQQSQTAQEDDTNKKHLLNEMQKQVASDR